MVSFRTLWNNLFRSVPVASKAATRKSSVKPVEVAVVAEPVVSVTGTANGLSVRYTIPATGRNVYIEVSTRLFSAAQLVATLRKGTLSIPAVYFHDSVALVAGQRCTVGDALQTLVDDGVLVRLNHESSHGGNVVYRLSDSTVLA